MSEEKKKEHKRKNFPWLISNGQTICECNTVINNEPVCNLSCGHGSCTDNSTLVYKINLSTIELLGKWFQPKMEKKVFSSLDFRCGEVGLWKYDNIALSPTMNLYATWVTALKIRESCTVIKSKLAYKICAKSVC